MKLFTISLCMFSFLISSSIFSAENKKTWVGWAKDGVNRAVISAKKTADPLPYALDTNNAAFVDDISTIVGKTSVDQFMHNTKLSSHIKLENKDAAYQDAVNSCITREYRASNCIIRAILDKNTPDVIALCQANKGNINRIALQLARKYLEEQQEDIRSTLEIPTSKPTENPSELLPEDLALEEKISTTSRAVLLAIRKNDITTIKDNIGINHSFLAPAIMSAAKNYLKQVGAIISAVMPSTIVSKDITHEDSSANNPTHTTAQGITQTTSTMPQITVTAAVKTTTRASIIASSVTNDHESKAEQSSISPTIITMAQSSTQQQTTSTAQRPNGKKIGPVTKQHDMQQQQ